MHFVLQRQNCAFNEIENRMELAVLVHLHPLVQLSSMMLLFTHALFAIYLRFYAERAQHACTSRILASSFKTTLSIKLKDRCALCPLKSFVY